MLIDPKRLLSNKPTNSQASHSASVTVTLITAAYATHSHVVARTFASRQLLVSSGKFQAGATAQSFSLGQIKDRDREFKLYERSAVRTVLGNRR